MSRLIFISHKETDKDVAAALVEFILATLDVTDDEVRCTSVPGHQLPFGKSIMYQLRDDLNTSTVLVALLTPESIKSTWVLFELGSSWALGKTVIPILGPGLTYSDLPGPLKDYTSVKITDDECSVRLRDAMKQIALDLRASEKTGGKAESKLTFFIKTFRSWKPPVQHKPVEQVSNDAVPPKNAISSQQAAILSEIEQNITLLDRFWNVIFQGDPSARTNRGPGGVFLETPVPAWGHVAFDALVTTLHDLFDTEDAQRIHSIHSALRNIQHTQLEMKGYEEQLAQISVQRADLHRRNVAESSMGVGLDNRQKQITAKNQATWMNFLDAHKGINVHWKSLSKVLKSRQ